jgi:general stress protein 26
MGTHHVMTDTRSLDDVLSGLTFAMVGTADRDGTWNSRPLALAQQHGDVLRFLVSTEAEWVQELEVKDSPTGVTFSDPGKNLYVGLQGHARTVDDKVKVKELMSAEAKAFFDSEDDPRARVLEVTVSHGEWWDGPSGRLGQKLGVLRAALGGSAGGKGDVAT